MGEWMRGTNHWATLEFSSPRGRWSRIILEKINTKTFLCVSCQPRGPSTPWGAVGDGPHDRFPAPVLDSPRGPL